MSYDDMPAQVEKSLYALGGASLRPRTKMERLHDMKKGLEAKLEEVNKAISLLEANPAMNEVIDALEKVGV